MQIIPPDIHVDFMGARRKAGIFSGVLVAVSLIAVAVMGLNLGIDFAGGSAIIASFQEEAHVERSRLRDTIRDMVAEETGDEDTQVTVQDFDVGVTGEEATAATHRYLVYTEITSFLTEEKREEIQQGLKEKFGEETRVSLPAQGADTFYLTFPEGVTVLERKQALHDAFASMGFDEVTVESELGRQFRISRIGEMNLILQEQRETGDEDAAAQDLILSEEAWQKKLEHMLEGKTDTRFTVKVEALKAEVEKRLAAEFGDAFVRVESSTAVSPSVGQDLLNNGLLAVLYAIIGILIYITLRFDFRFAPGAVVALIHDIAITMGIFAIFQIKFSLPIIAALLTIVGYSLNDTIVVLDRVRETFDAYRGRDIRELLNRAINGTLSRTVLTSLTTAFVIISILVFGGGLIRDFALALIIGVVVGTYSSIFVASPLVYYMDQYMERRDAQKARDARGSSANKPARA